MSGEDAWPLWLEEIITSAGEGVTVSERLGGGGKKITWDGYKIVVKHVCGKCNNGWMSRLESEAKPIMVPLITGDRSYDSIPAARCAVLTRWAVKTALIFDCTRQTRNRFYTADDGARLKLGISPSCAQTFVWLGRKNEFAIESCPVHAVGCDLYGYATGRTERVRSYATTLMIGFLVLQVLTVRASMDIDVSQVILHPKPAHERCTRFIWPWPVSRESVEWPPERSFLDASDLNGFASRFLMPAQPVAMRGSASIASL